MILLAVTAILLIPAAYLTRAWDQSDMFEDPTTTNQEEQP